MSYDTLNLAEESSGSLRAYYHTIDITALDGAGTEPYNPGSRFGVAVDGVGIVGQGDETYAVTYDHVADALKVRNLADGTAVAAGTAVGEVILRVEGK